MQARRSSLRVVLRVEGRRGSGFQFAGRQMQAGGIPDQTLRPIEDYVPKSAGARSPARNARPLDAFRHFAARALRHVALGLEPAAEPRDIAPTLIDDALAGDLLRTGDVLLRAGLFDQADAVLGAAKDVFPWRPELHSHHALCAQRRENFEQGAARWEEVARSFPGFATVHYSHAACLRALGHVDRAVAVIERHLGQHSDDENMLVEAALVFEAAARWHEAVTQWDRAIALRGPRPEWCARRSAALRFSQST